MGKNIMSEELYNYFFNNPKYRIDVSRRTYDGLFAVHRPFFEFAPDGSHSISWETIGVFDTNQEATDYVREFLSGKTA